MENMEIEETQQSSNEISKNKDKDDTAVTTVMCQMQAKKLQMCQYMPILQQPSSERIFMIIGDIQINIDQSSDLQFSETLRFNKQFRPVTSVKKNKGIQFSRINLDFSAQGLQDFRFIIHILKSMQNQELYKLSTILEQLQWYVNEEFKTQKSIKNSEYDQKSEIFASFQEKIIPQILKEEQQQNPSAYQMFVLGNCVKGTLDSRLCEIGLRDTYLNLIGTDSQTMESFYIREGWFESSWLLNSIEFTNLLLDKYVNSFALYKGLIQFEPFTYKILTLDLILIPATFYSKVYYFYNTEDLFYSVHLIPEMIDNIVGIFSVVTLEIEQEHINRLQELRAAKNTLQNNNLILNYIENNISKFQYEIQSDHFYNKFYRVPPKSEQKQELSIYDLYPEKVCGFKSLK